MRQCADGIAHDNPAMVQNFLEFCGGFGSFVRGQVGLPLEKDGIESAEEPEVAASGSAELTGNSCLQSLDSTRRLALFKVDDCPQRWEVAELYASPCSSLRGPKEG